jgi:hypothetical protein
MKEFFRGVSFNLRCQTFSDIMQTEWFFFSQWGGICSSCKSTASSSHQNYLIKKGFMENTPFYSTLGQQIMSSERSKDLESTMDVEFRLDLERRSDLMAGQILEDIWVETEQKAKLLHDLLWVHLWPTVESLAVRYILMFGEAGDEAD